MYAQQLKNEKSAQVHAVTFSSDIANKLSQYDIDNVIHVNDNNLQEYSPLHYIETFNQLSSELNPDLIIFGHTYETRDWVPRLSARLNIPFLSDCVGMSVKNTISYTRSLYQNKINTIYRFHQAQQLYHFNLVHIKLIHSAKAHAM